jgi:hypothetical protein
MWKDNMDMDLKNRAQAWIGFIWLGWVKMAGYYEHGNEPSGSIKFRKFFD